MQSILSYQLLPQMVLALSKTNHSITGATEPGSWPTTTRKHCYRWHTNLEVCRHNTGSGHSSVYNSSFKRCQLDSGYTGLALGGGWGGCGGIRNLTFTDSLYYILGGSFQDSNVPPAGSPNTYLFDHSKFVVVPGHLCTN